MTQTDATGTSKISALQTAVHQLLTMLQNASSTVGDVKAAIIPFSKTVAPACRLSRRFCAK